MKAGAKSAHAEILFAFVRLSPDWAKGWVKDPRSVEDDELDDLEDGDEETVPEDDGHECVEDMVGLGKTGLSDMSLS